MNVPGQEMYVKVAAAETAGHFALAEAFVDPEMGPPVHMHTHEDETFIVIDGLVEFTVGEEKILAGPGTTVWAPRGVKHTFKAAGEKPAHFYVMITGTNFEQFYAKYAPLVEEGNFARAAEVAEEHGIYFYPTEA